MTKVKGPEDMTATATLPGVTIEISHHRPPEGDREEMLIRLTAAPSFEAFGRTLEASNPFAFWASATQLAWSTWFQAAQAMMGHAAPQVLPVLPDRSGKPRSSKNALK